MPTSYCPHSGCGTAIKYEAVKPTKCPKCNRTFASAFAAAATTITAQPTVPPTPDDGEDMLPPVSRRRATMTPRQPGTVMTPRGGVVKASQEMDDDLDTETEEDLSYPDDGEPYDPRAARRLARELAASIDQDALLELNTGDTGPVRFEDWVQLGQPVAASKGKRGARRGAGKAKK